MARPLASRRSGSTARTTNTGAPPYHASGSRPSSTAAAPAGSSSFPLTRPTAIPSSGAILPPGNRRSRNSCSHVVKQPMMAPLLNQQRNSSPENRHELSLPLLTGRCDKRLSLQSARARGTRLTDNEIKEWLSGADRQTPNKINEIGLLANGFPERPIRQSAGGQTRETVP